MLRQAAVIARLSFSRLHLSSPAHLQIKAEFVHLRHGVTNPRLRLRLLQAATKPP
ncbi:hypothetical protein F2Q69_00020382 [Brassica cretica]|uniref:Uncharacterized protein n=1 Tax=Brassica cretica TaxID=69181 RepID=A0A8S9Q594_BRACR|nr:hypothetical protein F2Q69_00020382 [Brassica cretica]